MTGGRISVLGLAVVAALACAGKPPQARDGAGSSGAGGSGAGSAVAATPCDAARPKIAELYRADLRGRDAARIEEAIADNTAMVMNDCAKAPERTAACIAAATTARELEGRCLIQLDDEGTEGDALAR